MTKEVFICYWITEASITKLPTLDQMPAYVDIAPLAFVNIAQDSVSGHYKLDFSALTRCYSAETIQGWIRTVRQNGTKVLFSILDDKLGTIPLDQLEAFAASVAADVATWGVDGLDFDYEPSNYTDTSTLIPLIKALRTALVPLLPSGSVFTAPIFEPWTGQPALLYTLGGVVDYVSTMDYTPYPGTAEQTIELCNSYAAILAGPVKPMIPNSGWEKLVIGMSCMWKAEDDFTPLADVVTLAGHVPGVVPKAGAMLYTFTYDVCTRTNSLGTFGTGHPDGTWTKTIHENLPDR